MKEPPRYTLAEARRKLSEDECARYGHDYNIIVAGGRDRPVSIVCQRCGRSWNIGDERLA